MNAPLVQLQKVWHHIPLAIQSIYNRGSEGKLPWLTRVGPDGRRRRWLFVNVAIYDSWARARGIKVLLKDLYSGAEPILVQAPEKCVQDVRSRKPRRPCKVAERKSA